MYASLAPARGLGDEQSTLQNVQLGGSLAATAATTVVGTIAATGGSVLGLSGAALTAAVPVIGAAIAGVTILVIVLAKGCGQTCIVASNYANEAEELLKKNIEAYFAGPRTRASQTVALANYDTIWAALKRACGTPALQAAGERCITDRQEGACQWKQTSSSPLLAYPGEPQPGQCWNWFSGYRAPIANDAAVSDSAASQFTSSLGLPDVAGLPGWVLPVAVLGIAAVLL